MKSLELKYSKSQVDRAGEYLRAQNNASDVELAKSLEVLSNWRAYHAPALDSFAKVLRARVQKIEGSALVAQRLKRAPSIMLKLSSHKTMRLSAMQDIGGLRAILDGVDEVYELLDMYKRSKSKHSLNSLDDYIIRPKSDGYRSVHLVYKLKKSPSIFLEIQIRSKLQHMWATGVEVFGTLQNSSFKSGQGNKKWLEFFALLSSVFALKEQQPILKQHKKYSTEELIFKLKSLNQELKVLENLNVYTAVYSIVAEKLPSGRKGKYQLIVLNSREKTINYKSFGSIHFEEAANKYLELEQKHLHDSQVNVVLVNTGDLKKLEISYPNYFMDTKELVQNISLIMMDKFL